MANAWMGIAHRHLVIRGGSHSCDRFGGAAQLVSVMVAWFRTNRSLIVDSSRGWLHFRLTGKATGEHDGTMERGTNQCGDAWA